MEEKIYKTGEKPEEGAYYCTNCGERVDIGSGDKLPPCPRCSNNEFTQNEK